MLKALSQPDNPTYQYPSGTLQNVGTGTGKGSAITGAVAGLAAQPGVAAPLLGSLGVNTLRTPSPLGGAAGFGIGIGGEILGGLLKPKGQAATESPYGDLTDQYRRREEGSGEGTLGGAVKWGGRGAQIGSVVPGLGTAIGAGLGAIGGGIANAFTKNAKSAYSDFRTEDAVNAIKQMYQTRGGRLPTEQEVESILIGQGMDPRSAQTHTGFVGEKGLYSVLNSLDKNFAAERQGLVANAAGGGTPTPPAAPTAPVARLLGAGAGPGPAAQGGGGTYGPPAGAGGSSGVSPSTAPSQAPAPAPAPPETAPAAPGAASPAPALPTNADTDGYAAPQYTAVSASSAPPPGWDSKKWSDPAHQTPKYVVGRIMSQFAPTTENMPKVLAEIEKAYPGTRLIGKDTIDIPGVGKTDILRGADVGGKGWQWLGEHAPRGGGSAGGGGGTGAGYASGGDVAGGDVISQIIASLGGMAGGQGGPMTARDALLGQLGIQGR
jgi:hypothetical protein